MRTVKGATALHSEVEGDFRALLDDVCVEALFLVGRELVGEGCGRGKAREGAQKGQEGEKDQHGGGRNENGQLDERNPCRQCCVRGARGRGVLDLRRCFGLLYEDKYAERRDALGPSGQNTVLPQSDSLSHPTIILLQTSIHARLPGMFHYSTSCWTGSIVNIRLGVLHEGRFLILLRFTM